jgi:hypothetical protein
MSQPTQRRSPIWTEEQLVLMKTGYRDLGSTVIAARLNRTVRGVEAMAQKMGLSRKEPRWSKEEDELLLSLWPHNGMACAHRFTNRTLEAVKQHAVKLGVQSKKKVKLKPEKRRDQSCFGHIPGGAVRSVFDLGERA